MAINKKNKSLVTRNKRTDFQKTLDYYINLPWSYNIETTKEGGRFLYIVCVNELPGVCTDAPTIPKAMGLIKEAMKATFRLYLENGEQIPEPVDEEKYKDNIAYRTTSGRHFLIACEAQKKLFIKQYY